MAENKETPEGEAPEIEANEHSNESAIEATGLDLSKFAAEFVQEDAENITAGRPEAGEL